MLLAIIIALAHRLTGKSFLMVLIVLMYILSWYHPGLLALAGRNEAWIILPLKHIYYLDELFHFSFIRLYKLLRLPTGSEKDCGNHHIIKITGGVFAVQERVQSAGGGAALLMRKARGTVASRTTPLNNDVIGGLFGQVWANNGYRPAATIRFFADGDVTDAAANAKIQFQVQDGGIGGGTLKNAMTIRHTGAVGIGNEDVPTDFLFAVNGKAIATELLIQLQADWPDFVFNSDYNLMPLNELESFVTNNKHLPGIRSEADINAQGGVNVGETSALLLQKIEELTLYIIELNKRIEELEK
jgi:hypothetical protein